MRLGNSGAFLRFGMKNCGVDDRFDSSTIRLAIMQIAVGSCGRALLLAVLGTSACEPGQRFSADREFDEVIAAEGATEVILEFDVPVDVVGRARQDEVTVQGVVTVTTSSQAISDELAAGLEIESEISGNTLRLALRQPGDGAGTPFPDATISGPLDLTVPADVDLVVREGGGRASVTAVRGNLDVRAIGTVVIQGAERNVTLRTEVGGALVETTAAQGTLAEIDVGAGDVDVILPAVLSARVTANFPNGIVVINHPALPPPLPGQTFYDNFNQSGLSRVRVTAANGNVRFRL
ncbi:MAG: hypothetical protein ACFB9M_17055 [Myxococcota bacterium]